MGVRKSLELSSCVLEEKKQNPISAMHVGITANRVGAVKLALHVASLLMGQGCSSLIGVLRMPASCNSFFLSENIEQDPGTDGAQKGFSGPAGE